MKKSLLLILFFLPVLMGAALAQNPYASIGKTTEVLTLSNGKYQEFFHNDTIVRIGTVLLNTVTKEIVDFITVGDTSNTLEADVTSRFLSVDPIGREYPELTPYQFASNTPIQAIDLDGLEAFFVSGAGGDAIGWNYTQRFKDRFIANGFDFIPIKASHSWEWTQRQGIPPVSDIKFTASYRKSGWVTVPKNDNTLTGGTNPINVRLAAVDGQVLKVVKTIKDQKVKGKQLNLLGYSYGSVVMAHAALAANDAGIQIDNLILIGSPIPSDSELFNELSSKMNVIRYDIPTDLLSNPRNDSDFLNGGKQNSADSGPHFDLARPDNPNTKDKNEADEANKMIDNLVKFLKDKGMKDLKN